MRTTKRKVKSTRPTDDRWQRQQYFKHSEPTQNNVNGEIIFHRFQRHCELNTMTRECATVAATRRRYSTEMRCRSSRFTVLSKYICIWIHRPRGTTALANNLIAPHSIPSIATNWNRHSAINCRGRRRGFMQLLHDAVCNLSCGNRWPHLSLALLEVNSDWMCERVREREGVRAQKKN